MSARPFFTVAVPSKNRPEQLRLAARSVLAQTFPDLELIVCDNSDEAEAAATEAVVRELSDPRVVYVRTSGRLSMPDNWERAVADARGEYVGILTDRSVYYPHILERAHREIQATGVPLIGWLPESYGRGPSGRDFRSRACTGGSSLVESRRLLEFFLHGHPKNAPKRVPKLMSAMCSRTVIEQIRASSVGRVCPPVCPDYTSGYLMLAFTDRTMLLDEAGFVSCGRGNGSAFRRRGALATRFLHDLGMTWRDLVDRMPTRACFTSALVLNDLMRLKEQLPDRFAGYGMDRTQYYLGCLTDYERAARRGTELFEDLDELLEGLNLESPAIQAAVRTRTIYFRAAVMLPPDVASREEVAVLEGDGSDGRAHPEFETVFDAMAWAAGQPRPVRNTEPGVTALTMPGLDTVEAFHTRRKRRPTRQKKFEAQAPSAAATGDVAPVS
jgi:glycosyltransferase involved in cell wall biosynthesis